MTDLLNDYLMDFVSQSGVMECQYVLKAIVEYDELQRPQGNAILLAILNRHELNCLTENREISRDLCILS